MNARMGIEWFPSALGIVRLTFRKFSREFSLQTMEGAGENGGGDCCFPLLVTGNFPEKILVTL